MNLKGKKIAFGLTDVFYALENTVKEIKHIVALGGKVIPIFNEYNDRYEKTIKKIEEIVKRKVIIAENMAEKVEADIMVIAPCSRKYYFKTFKCNI